MVGTSELHEPAVVHDAVHDRGGDLVIGEDRVPAAELHVDGEHDAPLLMRIRYGLVGQAGHFDFEGNVPNSSSMTSDACPMSATSLSRAPSRFALPSRRTSEAAGGT